MPGNIKEIHSALPKARAQRSGARQTTGRQGTHFPSLRKNREGQTRLPRNDKKTNANLRHTATVLRSYGKTPREADTPELYFTSRMALAALSSYPAFAMPQGKRPRVPSCRTISLW
jgi:hypothetical protein